MKFTKKNIEEKLLELPGLNPEVTISQNEINAIQIDDDKLSIDFNIQRTRTPAFQNFQKNVLKLLKIELGIDKVSLQFLPAPDPQELQQQQLASHLNPNSKYIAVVSGKGGVGKSTVTVGIAKALQAQGKKVAIIDADIYGASIPQILQIGKSAPQILDNKVKPFDSNGIEVISSSLLISDYKPVMWKGPMLSKMLTQFFTDVAWSSDIDYFLLDMPPGTGDIMLELSRIVPHSEMLIITTPQDDAAAVATKAGIAALELEHPIIGVIENMSYVACEKCGDKNYIFGQGGGYYVAEALGSECLAQLPLSQNISLDDYQPIIHEILEA